MKLLVELAIAIIVVQIAQSKDGRHLDLDEPEIDAPLEAHNDPQDESIVLGKDKESGCLCRQYPIEKFVTCYDPVSCKRFPKNVKFRLNTIRISTTGIKVLYKNDLLNNTHLTNFLMEGNDEFSKIEPGAFNGMKNLVNISITHNKNLLRLDNDSFTGLTNLTYLKLYKNGFSSIKDFTISLSPKHLPNLKYLVIGQMPFPIIETTDFEDLENTKLETLNLFTCKIDYIEPTTFSWFRKLKVLGIGENNLNATNIKEILSLTRNLSIPLEYLSLYNLGFKELPMELLNEIALTNITHLSLKGNRFEIIGEFPEMPNIQRLDLIKVIALNITPRAFEKLPNLRVLYLNNNLFSDIPKAALMPQLEFLDISYSGTYFTLGKDNFVNMTNLVHLNLSGNNMRKLSENTFKGLTNLRALGLKESKLFFIENATFASMKNLLYLDLRNNNFPTRYFNKSIFDGLENLEELRLGGCLINNIDTDVLSNFKSLKRLRLENNQLRTIPSEILSPLTNLELLDISTNTFTSWDQRMFANNPKLTTLIASDNKIKNITKSMTLDFENLKVLDLHKNPFGCECSDMDALSEIVVYNQQKPNLFRLLSQHQLNCTFPERNTDKTILDYLNAIAETHECFTMSYTYRNTTVITFSSISVFSVFIIFLFFFIYRGHVRYWVFLFKLYLSGNERKGKENVGTNYDYDAFVSYSNEDREFVTKLVNTLESTDPFYKLCVYERDFQIGTVISESVWDCLSRSKKMLLIVSEAYIKSSWCRYEVQVAEDRRLLFENENEFYSDDSFVIVKLGEVSTTKLCQKLKFLMKTRIYLQWDEDPKKEKAFWDKLRTSLGPPISVFTIDSAMKSNGVVV